MAARLQQYLGWRVTDVQVDSGMSSKAARKYLPADEYNAVIGEAITGVHRRGKYMIFSTSSGALLCHNAMSGYWDASSAPWTFDYVEGKREARETDVRVWLKLTEGLDFLSEEVTLRFHDARKFGSLRFMEPSALAEKLSGLGPDAIETPYMYELNWSRPEGFIQSMLSDSRPVKEVLMDQRVVAGVGNIYASEACFLAGVSPLRPASSIQPTYIDAKTPHLFGLWLAMRSVLYCAIKRELDYAPLRVYRKKECYRCKGAISSQEIKGRSTWWCPSCQN